MVISITMERVAKIFSGKAFFITFSVLVSIALWMYVEINENQMQTHIVRDVPVVRQNIEVLNDRGLLISSINPEYVTLTFECPRSVAARLTNTTLSVAIDLTGVSTRGNTTLPLDIIYPSNVDENSINLLSRTVNRISLYIDRLESRPVPVEVIYRGGAAEGYLQDPPEFSPQAITVSGPAETVSQVSKARVLIDRENLTATYTDEHKITLLDEDGEELSEILRDQVSLSDDMIWVNIPIRVVKEIVLTVERNYGSGATADNTLVTITPQTIMVAGEPEDIRDFNSIILGTIDLTRFEFTDTQAFKIVMPNNVTPISGENEALVMVEILGLEIRHFSVSNSYIYVTNVPSGFVPVIGTQSVDVRIRGRAEDMVNLTEANIRVVVNAADENTGSTQRVLARVIVDGIDPNIVGAIGNNYVTYALIEDSQ